MASRCVYGMPFLYHPGDSHIMRTVMSRSRILAVIFAAFMALQAGADEPAAGTGLYTVVEGYKVDPATMKGFRAWRAGACEDRKSVV